MRPRRVDRSQDDDVIEMTKHSHVSSEDAGQDIQVVTDISVQVEGGSGRLSGWRTSVSKQEWEEKVVGPKGSTDTLTRDERQVV
jgi:hypothetical protein